LMHAEYLKKITGEQNNPFLFSVYT
jgi:hypothetical protein